MATFDDFMKLDIRVGTILNAKNFEKAKRPAYQMEIDFGKEIGIKWDKVGIIREDYLIPGCIVGGELVYVVIEVKHHRNADDEKYAEDVGPQELLYYVSVKSGE